MEGKLNELDGVFFEQGQELVTDAGRMRFDYETVARPPLHPNCHCTDDPILIETEPA